LIHEAHQNGPCCGFDTNAGEAKHHLDRKHAKGNYKSPELFICAENWTRQWLYLLLTCNYLPDGSQLEPNS
jgi:hypothetical protein